MDPERWQQIERLYHTALEQEAGGRDAFLAEEPRALARFKGEAKAVAALSHPNILAIHDFGTEQGASFAVMELLQGETLRDRLGRSALPWRKAVKVGVAIADGLAAAHA